MPTYTNLVLLNNIIKNENKQFCFCIKLYVLTPVLDRAGEYWLLNVWLLALKLSFCLFVSKRLVIVYFSRMMILLIFVDSVDCR